ncbi:MAG: IS200/IS605 family transposase [Chloroflexi bacterium]|nr:IS200/IS605 family transposase [Chloroflexota bacterium]
MSAFSALGFSGSQMALASGGARGRKHLMSFWRCYFHVIWTTYRREPVITSQMEKVIFESVRRKSTDMACDILAMNGVADHIHVAVSIPPKVAAAEWIRNVKGLSAHEINQMFPNLDTHSRWQNSYGVLTFGAKNLPFVIDYIENQKAHHNHHSIEPYLERVDDD